uniref:mitogen-activated protein kinase kinase n=1 Tax=Romanomermis culicivorax TaxID=13658 RepID=A0A915J9W7_ROMCU
MRKKPGPSLSKLPQPSEPEPHPKPPVNLEDHCSMTFQGRPYDVRAEDLVKIKELGRGNYGFRIRVTLNNEEQKRMLIELNASMQSGQCPQMVKFFGAMFKEGDVWLCMEVMDMSLDKFYRNCVDYNLQICEPVLGFIAYSVIEALHYMKKVLNLMHRDVKPSNILINKQGCVKLCDFGISGHMTDSVAKTINAGCKPYMAPERINPGNEAQQAYDIRSDVWNFKQRPRFAELLTHPFVVQNRDQSSTTASFFDQLSTAIASDEQRLSLAPPTEQLTVPPAAAPTPSSSSSASDVNSVGSSSADSDKIRRPNFS